MRCCYKLKISRLADKFVVVTTMRKRNAEIFNLASNPPGYGQFY